MTATVRLDKNLEEKLNSMSKTLHKKKSDVIREAIVYYANKVNDSKENRILNAVSKTKQVDKELYNDFEETISDAI